MSFLIVGLLLLWLASAGLRRFLRANPAQVAILVRRGCGALAFAVALLMVLRGRIDIAIGLAGFGWWFASGRHPALLRGFAKPRMRRSRRVSCVRSAMVEMELDHGTGIMTGIVLAGPDEGRSLDQLTRERCFSLFRLCLADDREGARLLEAYFDRRFTGWRQAEDGGGDARHAGASSQRDRGGPGGMSEDEAHEVLGLAKSASREEITRAHRALMKKFHPDHGGSTDLAARVNEAKDVLMRRHP